MKAAAKEASVPTSRLEYSPKQWRSLATLMADHLDDLEMNIQSVEAYSCAEQNEAIAEMREVASTLRTIVADIRVHAQDEDDEPESGTHRRARRASR